MERDQVKSYRNFNAALYCPVSNINSMTDLEAFDKAFQHIEKTSESAGYILKIFAGKNGHPRSSCFG